MAALTLPTMMANPSHRPYETHQPETLRPWLNISLLTLLIFSVDRLTKVWVLATLPLGVPQPAWSGICQWHHVHNTGVAFSLLAHTPLPWLPLALSISLLTIAVGSLWYYRHQWQHNRWRVFAIGLTLGGACGNGWERWQWGYVVDFIDITAINFPVFNVADIAISLGAALWIGHVLTNRPGPSQHTAAPHQEQPQA